MYMLQVAGTRTEGLQVVLVAVVCILEGPIGVFDVLVYIMYNVHYERFAVSLSIQSFNINALCLIRMVFSSR